jgi:hypothetical protein
VNLKTRVSRLEHAAQTRNAAQHQAFSDECICAMLGRLHVRYRSRIVSLSLQISANHCKSDRTTDFRFFFVGARGGASAADDYRGPFCELKLAE